MKNLYTLGKSLLALGALFVFAAPALAQTPTAPPAQKYPHPMKDLSLTKAQKAKMQAIGKDAKAKRQALRANTTLTPAQKKAQMQALTKDSMAKAGSVLTPAQLAKWKAERAANRASRIKR